MIPSAATPILRPAFSALLDASEAVRRARRLMSSDHDASAEERRTGALKNIDDAIAQLVAARAQIAPISETPHV